MVLQVPIVSISGILRSLLRETPRCRVSLGSHLAEGVETFRIQMSGFPDFYTSGYFWILLVLPFSGPDSISDATLTYPTLNMSEFFWQFKVIGW